MILPSASSFIFSSKKESIFRHSQCHSEISDLLLTFVMVSRLIHSFNKCLLDAHCVPDIVEKLGRKGKDGRVYA